MTGSLTRSPLIYVGEERFASFEEVDDRFRFEPASASGI